MTDENKSKINNIDINKKGNFVLVSINPKIYPLEIIYSAAYTFIDRAYVIIDGNPSEELFVELKLKEKGDLETLGREFNNELVNYAVYAVQSVRTQNVRDALVEKVFSSNTEDATTTQETETDVEDEDDEFKGMDYETDPAGITKPWTSEKKEKDVCKCDPIK